MALLSAATLAYTAPTDEQREFVSSFDDLMVNDYGRKYEFHTVTTPQEWELTLFRIMPDDGAAESNGRSVLFQHGATGDAELWVRTADRGNRYPAFFELADQGYDVWMGNDRATEYSNVNPRWPDADSNNLWKYREENYDKYDWSWYDQGEEDLPAVLDKIIEVSGNSKVSYVGYSQGTE